MIIVISDINCDNSHLKRDMVEYDYYWYDTVNMEEIKDNHEKL